MDLFFFISSVNKIAIVAFIITFIAIIYEIYLLIHEKSHASKPFIPDLRATGKTSTVKVAAIRQKPEKIKLNRPNKRTLFLLIAIFIIFCVIYALGNLLQIFEPNITNRNNIDKTTVKIISSSGIKIYDMNFQEQDGITDKNIRSGEVIYIALENISGSDIDRARIRVNTDSWSISDETDLYNSQKKIFYRQYQVASNESVLKIEAQLHSRADGWLGQ
ncbi:hypothetical protein A3J15_03255 [Candidatus Roizmanbacteria bacterium RIFCSPLOWO2_02_FULL_38_10]|uniref:Uncharacterized protein n=1 Tax=Candidatus Roizmanbacteria bacterium RIFCSPLOWO2_02_FULL_38_10 TaxID=1802074 RepID=A0A1F7JM53_9BACT|nr:MAG: hypothetical protein A3J15_03255 [Candidatus Roizmanbacteria bacterium RIFCSPLOWO2_02_FULL_38_10]